MTFRRFLAWIVEKLFELQLLILLLVAVKVLLPVGLHSYASVETFRAGVTAQWHAALDEAAFMAQAFMNGNYALYAFKLWQAAAWVIGIQFYFWSFYIFTSALACLAGDRGYIGKALLAYSVSAGVLAWRQQAIFDLNTLPLAGALLVGGMLAVIASALFGRYVDVRLGGGKAVKARGMKPAASDSVRGRVRFDLSQ